MHTEEHHVAPEIVQLAAQPQRRARCCVPKILDARGGARRHPDNIASIILNQALTAVPVSKVMFPFWIALKRWQKCMDIDRLLSNALLVASRLEMVMADARDGVARHDFEAVFRKPVDGVPRIVDGQPGCCPLYAH